MASSDGDSERREIELSRLNLNINMVGIGLAIFTFLLLFFLSASSSNQEIYQLLFQVTLGLVVASVFSFGVAGLYNYVLVYSVPSKASQGSIAF